MNLFSTTLDQIAYLFSFIVIGYGLVKLRVLPAGSAAVLSKLENWVFIPALVLGTFMDNFTVSRLGEAGELLGISFIIALIAIPLAIAVSRWVTGDRYIQRIYTYGLAFSNFGFMGNAVVSSLFPHIFLEYLIFTLPLWVLIYLWGVPRLLIADTEKKHTLRESLRSFVNPMFIAMLVGMGIGLAGISLPSWTRSLITVSGQCMSPIAMLLTGVVVSSIPLKKTFTNGRIYLISAVRLVLLPLAFMGIARLVPIPETAYLCALCSLAMPLGLNTIVIPSALGKDTTVAAGMAVISHLMCCITIPVIFSMI